MAPPEGREKEQGTVSQQNTEPVPSPFRERVRERVLPATPALGAALSPALSLKGEGAKSATGQIAVRQAP